MPPDTSQKPLTVTALTQRIKRVLEGEFTFLAVCGELSDVTKPNSGHIYFTLKDKRAQLRGVIWRNQAERLNCELSDGLEVVCRGSLEVYGARGNYQFSAQAIQPLGQGSLQQRLRELERKLAAQGYFDPDKKRPLPRFPQHVVVVTSPTGAAIRDFLEVARRRWQNVRITVAPVKVQGERAGIQLAHAVKRLQCMHPAPDVMVITRGGGSFEDLWCFNEEALVRAIHDSTIPIVSAVGHEVDVTLCDLAADVRALTPSESAERVLPSADDLRLRVAQLQQQLGNALRQKAADCRQQLLGLSQRRVMQQPLEAVNQRQRQLDELQQRAIAAMRRQLREARAGLGAAAAHLDSLSPLNVLARGYNVALDEDGKLLGSAAQLTTDQQLRLKFCDGEAGARIESVDLYADTEPRNHDH